MWFRVLFTRKLLICGLTALLIVGFAELWSTAQHVHSTAAAPPPAPVPPAAPAPLPLSHNTAPAVDEASEEKCAPDPCHSTVLNPRPGVDRLQVLGWSLTRHGTRVNRGGMRMWGEYELLGCRSIQGCWCCAEGSPTDSP